MIWKQGTDGRFEHNGPYTIYRNARDWAAWRFDANPKCLGRCVSRLEAELLCSVDAVLQSTPVDAGHEK
jgi:hypothetical protein